VAKRSFILLPVILASALAGTQVLAQASEGPEPHLKNAFVGGSLACSQQPATQQHTIYVPRRIAERARLKAHLLNLLRESLYDDARGVVNIARENEIKKLANKLRDNKTE
jgi:hypothetical protein